MKPNFTTIPFSIGSTAKVTLLKLKVSSDAARVREYLDMFSAGQRPTFEVMKSWLKSQKIEHRIEEMLEPLIFLPEQH